jgi:uncharacterized protein (TIGR03083 family)
MRPEPPLIVVDLFADERDRLLDLLESLPQPQWDLPTACPGWSVKDVVAHIFGDDLNNLSGGRDHHRSAPFEGSGWTDLVAFVNERNEAWVDALRRLSPRALIELLGFSGSRLQAYFRSLDPMAIGPNVAWAGRGEQPMWLHLAREYTERWLHQMQMREAVGAPGLYEWGLFHPVLDTFAQALPVAYGATEAPAGTHVRVDVRGDAGGRWSLVREAGRWVLAREVETAASAIVRLDQVTAWKLWTKGMPPQQAQALVQIEGDLSLGEPVLRAVAIIA